MVAGSASRLVYDPLESQDRKVIVVVQRTADSVLHLLSIQVQLFADEMKCR